MNVGSRHRLSRKRAISFDDFDEVFEVPLKHVKDTVELVSGGITLIDGRSNARNNKKDPIEQSHDVRKQRRRGTKVHIDIGIAAVGYEYLQW